MTIKSLLRCGCLIGLVLLPALAAAQAPSAVPPPASAPVHPEQNLGFFATIGRWLDRQSQNLQSAWQGVDHQVRNLGREATIAAQTSAEGAKQAAGAVANLHNARVVTGYQRCAVAPNGAPDCLQAVANLCKSQGFQTGTSLDMTTAEDCPTKVYLAGRNSGPECTSFTFVSRALCQ